MFKNPILKKAFLGAAMMSNGIAAFAQTATSAPDNTDYILDFVLIVIALILLFAIYSLSRILTQTYISLSPKEDGDSAKSGSKTTALLMLFALALPSTSLFAQTAAPAAAASLPMHTWALLLLIFIELAVVFALNSSISGLIKPKTAFSDTQSVADISVNPFDMLTAWWAKANNFVSVEQEAGLDTGHNYDGIRELDNVTPSWFTAAFMVSIAVACIYLWRFQIAGTAPLMLEEYAQEVAVAEAEHKEFLKGQANSVDENSVKMLGDADISAGKVLFVAQCAACHKADGGGSVGPNLTDDYWLHGGSISEVFKSIKYGWTEKGMKSWSADFSPAQIAQISSFVKSLKGTKPAEPKEPQGDLEQARAAPADATKTK